jgi:hypothetical protein
MIERTAEIINAGGGIATARRPIRYEVDWWLLDNIIVPNSSSTLSPRYT